MLTGPINGPADGEGVVSGPLRGRRRMRRTPGVAGLSASVPIEAFIDNVVELLNDELKRRGLNGLEPGVGYELHKANGVRLDVTKTLDELGVEDGATLSLVPAVQGESFEPQYESLSTGLARIGRKLFEPVTVLTAAHTRWPSSPWSVRRCWVWLYASASRPIRGTRPRHRSRRPVGRGRCGRGVAVVAGSPGHGGRAWLACGAFARHQRRIWCARPPRIRARVHRGTCRWGIYGWNRLRHPGATSTWRRRW